MLWNFVFDTHFETYCRYSGVYNEKQKKVLGIFEKSFEIYSRYCGKFLKTVTTFLGSFELGA